MFELKPLAWLRRAAKKPRWRHQAADHVRALAFPASSSTLAAGDAAGQLVLASLFTRKAVVVPQAHAGGVLALAWKPDGQVLASAGEDGSVAFWNAEGRLLHRHRLGHWVEHLVAEGHGGGVVAAAGKRLVRWPWAGLTEAPDEAPPGGGAIQALACRPDGGVVVARARQLQILSPQEDWGVEQALEHPGLPVAIAPSPDGRHLVVGNHDATLLTFMDGGADRLAMRGYALPIRQLAWDAKARWLASGGNDAATLWDFSGAGPAGSRPLVLEGHEAALSSLAFQRQRPRLASGCEGGWVLQWRPDDGDELQSHHDLGQGVSTLAWSPDDRFLVAGGCAGALAAYEACP